MHLLQSNQLKAALEIILIQRLKFIGRTFYYHFHPLIWAPFQSIFLPIEI